MAAVLDRGAGEVVLERRVGQRRRQRVGRCRRCKGVRYVPTGEPEVLDPNGSGAKGTPIKRCSCVERAGPWPFAKR